MKTTTTMLDAALELAEHDVHVLPAFGIIGRACACGSKSCRGTGKHPIGQGWQDRGSISEGDIEAAFAEAESHGCKAFNLSIPTGKRYKLVVLDVDGPPGELSLKKLEAEHGNFTDRTWTAQTGGGGWHHYFKAPAIPVKSSAGKLGKGLDLRGEGGQVIAPPSTHLSGNPYRWIETLTPWDIALDDLPELPGWLVDLANGKTTRARTAPVRNGDDGNTWIIPDGQRNEGLAAYAGMLRRRALGQREIAPMLLAMNRERCRPPLDDAEVLAIAASISRYAPGSPERPRARSGKPRPAIPARAGVHGLQLSEIVDMALAELGKDDRLYKRGEEIVQVIDTDTGPALRGITEKALFGKLLEAADWIATRKATEAEIAEMVKAGEIERGDEGPHFIDIAAKPDRDIAPTILTGSPESWPFREIRGITRTPIMREDGSILDAPGYDPRSRMLYLPDTDYEAVPPTPRFEDAMKALELLREPLADFAFSSEGGESSALAMLLTPLAVNAIPRHDCIPGFLVTARDRGSGKTLLSELPGILATGEGPLMASPARGDEEDRKRISALLSSAPRSVVVDNIQGRFGSASWSALLTAHNRLWTDRKLGRNDQTMTIPNDATWIFTGNNVSIGDDIGSRLVAIDIDPGVERPDKRPLETFRIRRLRAWMREHRRRLVPAALTVLRAGYLAGLETPRESLGRFHAWSRIVTAPLMWLGLANPAEEADRRLADADSTVVTLRELLAAWAETFEDKPVSARDAVAHAERHKGELLEAILEAQGGDGPANSRRFGNYLSSIRGRIVNGRRFELGTRSGGKRRWRVERLD